MVTYSSAASLTRRIFVVGAKRTPFGAFGGKLKDINQTQLGVLATKAALAQANVAAEFVDSVTFGMVSPATPDAAYLARHIALKSGVPIPAPALHVNRLCGSGFQAVVEAAKEITLGESHICVAGGTENMSQAPYAVFNTRFGTRLGQPPQFHDMLWDALTDSHIKTPMAITAENLATQYKISRADCDAFALASQQRWGLAHHAGLYEAEIAPVEVKGKKGKEMMTHDEHPRPQSTAETLAKLPAVFKENGTVTAGNASGICDGAAAVVVASEEAVRERNLKPLARVVAWSVAGVDPAIMGIGPVPAIRKLLKQTGLTLADIDLIEINEAFAAQTLACQIELKIDAGKLNQEGGAIALGHPLGASGARIVAHLSHMLHKKNARLAIGSACIGGGQGIAVLLERV